MKKFLIVILMLLVYVAGYSQVASYGKMTYDCKYGFYFDGITRDGYDSFYVGKTVEDAITTIDELIGICYLESDNAYMAYKDKKDNVFVIIKRNIPDGNKEIKILYTRPYGKPGVCEWYILECELREILSMLSNWGK